LHENGKGDKIVKGQIVTLNYKISLLDGTVCYSSSNDGQKVFQVGKGGVESGLEEGILMLRKGSKATFIMPPHLAHGLVGDDDRIPSRAILKYEVEVVNVDEK
jgi:FKBP-type peptidyl-prolyl cis-trans isomerase